VILTDQAKETAQAIGELYAKKMELDIKMAIMEKTSGRPTRLRPVQARKDRDRTAAGKVP